MGLGARAISEDRVEASKARELRLLCPHCNSSVFVSLAYPFTLERRQRRISAAINEHRGLCSAAPPEAGRVYEISYPRA